MAVHGSADTVGQVILALTRQWSRRGETLALLPQPHLAARHSGGVGLESMKRLNWIWLAGALLAIPGAFAAFAFVDATFELGVLHSTWQSAVAIFGSVSLGLYLLWQVEFRARWQRTISMLGYAPIMFALVAWLGVAIQFAFDDCMSAQQSAAADRRESAAPAQR